MNELELTQTLQAQTGMQVVSVQTAQERLGYDPEAEGERLEDEQARTASAQANDLAALQERGGMLGFGGF
jgi:peptidoglycan hydrolase-like protein with peptidoglycan-binding domain